MGVPGTIPESVLKDLMLRISSPDDPGTAFSIKGWRRLPLLRELMVTLVLWTVMTFPGANASAMAAGGGEHVVVGLASSSLSLSSMGVQRLSGGGSSKKKVAKKGPAKGKKGGVEKPEKRKWWEGGSKDPAKGRLKFRHHFFKKTQSNAVKGCGTMPGTGGRQLLKPGSTRVLPDEQPANRPKLLKWKGKCSGQAINKLGDKKQLIVRPNWSLWK